MQPARLRIQQLREAVRARGMDGLSESTDRPPVSRRLVRVTGAGPARDVVMGDLAILDRRVLGRRSLMRLAEELALRGAAGLIVSEETIAPLPADLRRSIEDRIPLLVVGSEWDRARAWLLDLEPAASRMTTGSVIRSALRGHAHVGPLPGDLDPARPIRSLVVTANSDGQIGPVLEVLEEIAAVEAELADPRSYVLATDGVVAVLSNQYGSGHDGDTLGRAVLLRATTSVATATVTVGIGRPYPGIAGMRRSYREAKWAATVGEMMWGGNRVISFRELGIYGLLEPFVTDPTTTDTQDVEKLLEYDRQNQTALLPTVEAYFDSTRSGDVAASLFVHRNTIAYRLRAVRRVTGLDIVGDPDARLLLQVQIRLARLWGVLPAGPVHTVTRRTRPS